MQPRKDIQGHITSLHGRRAGASAARPAHNGRGLEARDPRRRLWQLSLLDRHYVGFDRGKSAAKFLHFGAQTFSVP